MCIDCLAQCTYFSKRMWLQETIFYPQKTYFVIYLIKSMGRNIVLCLQGRQVLISLE